MTHPSGIARGLRLVASETSGSRGVAMATATDGYVVMGYGRTVATAKRGCASRRYIVHAVVVFINICGTFATWLKST